MVFNHAVVHCNSGNRTGQAETLLEDAGFTNIINAGPIEDASQETGLEIVQ